ncbi:MAG: DUF3365 domain-containing protein, partial [Verrucomicrobiota bacterium]
EKLRKNQVDPVSHFELAEDGTEMLRYFSPVIMGRSCVDCHNSHADSPKTDWRVGDIRGYQEVTLPMIDDQSAMLLSKTTFRDLILFALISFGIALFVISLSLKGNAKAFQRLKELVKKEKSRSLELIEVTKKAEEANRA